MPRHRGEVGALDLGSVEGRRDPENGERVRIHRGCLPRKALAGDRVRALSPAQSPALLPLSRRGAADAGARIAWRRRGPVRRARKAVLALDRLPRSVRWITRRWLPLPFRPTRPSTIRARVPRHSRQNGPPSARAEMTRAAGGARARHQWLRPIVRWARRPPDNARRLAWHERARSLGRAPDAGTGDGRSKRPARAAPKYDARG